MLQYVFNEDNEYLEPDEPITFVAEDQIWDKATLKQLKDEYNIVFMTSGNGVIPIMIVNKNGENPWFVLGSEDDGRIYFERRYGQLINCFSPYWIKPLIADLEEVLRILEEDML